MISEFKSTCVFSPEGSEIDMITCKLRGHRELENSGLNKNIGATAHQPTVDM